LKPFTIRTRQRLIRDYSLDNEQALIAKVNEALSVYDEYVKARREDDNVGEGATNNDNENKADDKKEGDKA
jgi:hypothetical protein